MQKNKGVEPERCKVQVKILKMSEGEDLKAIEFSRLFGSARLFYEHFKILSDKLDE
jgi:hypothetical protein